MPNRIIRADLLSSESYWSVTTEARQLYVHLLLCADDYGLHTANNYTLRSICYGLEKPAAEKVEKWLSELHDAGLVLLYDIDGQRYLMIPKFRQFLRNSRSKCKVTPLIFNELAKELHCICIADDMHVQYSGKKEKEKEKGKGKKKTSSADADRPTGFDTFWTTWPASPRKVSKAECLKRWKARNLEAIAAQIVTHVAVMKAAQQWRDGFEPAPLTYLNQRRWEDDLPPVQAGSENPFAGAL